MFGYKKLDDYPNSELCFMKGDLAQTGHELPLTYRDTVTEVQVTHKSHLQSLSKGTARINSVK